MSIVDVDTVAGEDKSKLIDEALAASLDPQDFQDFQVVVGYSFLRIDLLKAQNLLEGRTISLNDPVVIRIDQLASAWVI